MHNRFLQPTENFKTISEAAESIIKMIPSATKGARALRVVIFGSATNTEEYLRDREIIAKLFVENFSEDEMPVWSYISQPPFETLAVAEVWWMESEEEWTIERRECVGVKYISVVKGDTKGLLVGGLSALSATENRKIGTQSDIICDQIAAILKQEQMPLNSIIRQWNYIEQITLEDADNQNYQEFNDARSRLYAASDWELGYPAATGIGMLTGGIVIDFDAVVGEETIPIDNKLQVAAHEYSKDVLLGEASQKTTPKFERAKLCGDLMYISGTAAIRGEESLVGVSGAEQTRITLENIDELREVGKTREARRLRVYIKYKEDFPQIREVVEQYAKNDAIYLYADICRDELLVEIEGVAYR